MLISSNCPTWYDRNLSHTHAIWKRYKIIQFHPLTIIPRNKYLCIIHAALHIWICYRKTEIFPHFFIGVVMYGDGHRKCYNIRIIGQCLRGDFVIAICSFSSQTSTFHARAIVGALRIKLCGNSKHYYYNLACWGLLSGKRVGMCRVYGSHVYPLPLTIIMSLFFLMLL